MLFFSLVFIMPDAFYNPFAQDIPPDPNIPGFPPMPTVPPPSNPLAPFVPPMMDTDCPHQDPCGDKNPQINNFQECVGYDPFGFSDGSSTRSTASTS